MPKLLMLQGLPGSAKTTLAQELETTGWVRVNKDDIRTELAKEGWVWNPKAESQVIEIRNTKIMVALQNGKNVVSDDTNFGRKHKNALLTIAKVAGAEFELKPLDVPLEVCLTRNAQREGTARVPDHVIHKMWGDFVRDNPYVFPKSSKPLDIVVEKYVPPSNCMKAVICDLDGTLALCEGRRNVYDATDCDRTDLLNRPVWDIISALWRYNIWQIVYLTGRSEIYREPTERFLKLHNCPPGTLLMRADGDSRNGTICKLDLFNAHVRARYDVQFALDDMDKIVKMWHSIGIDCVQVHSEKVKHG